MGRIGFRVAATPNRQMGQGSSCTYPSDENASFNVLHSVSLRIKQSAMLLTRVIQKLTYCEAMNNPG